MSWGSHPDSLTMAHARGVANRANPDPNSREHVQALRDFYADPHGAPELRGHAELLAGLDARLAEFDAGSDQPTA